MSKLVGVLVVAILCYIALNTLGWRLPVGYDRDGAVANVYAVAVCPTTTFAYRGGRVAGTALSALDTAGVLRWLRRIRGR